MCVRGIGSIQIYCVTNHQCPTTLPPHPKPLYACSRWHSHPCRWPLDHCFYQRSQLSHDSAASSTATNTSSPPVCLPCPGLGGLSPPHSLWAQLCAQWHYPNPPAWVTNSPYSLCHHVLQEAEQRQPYTYTAVSSCDIISPSGCPLAAWTYLDIWGHICAHTHYTVFLVSPGGNGSYFRAWRRQKSPHWLVYILKPAAVGPVKSLSRADDKHSPWTYHDTGIKLTVLLRLFLARETSLYSLAT